MVAVDGFAVFVQTVVLIATLLALFLSSGYLARENSKARVLRARCCARPPACCSWRRRTTSSSCSWRSRSCRSRCTCWPRSTGAGSTSQEAGLKYFVLGSFSSAVFLYGIALVYGATGTTNLTRIARVPRDDDGARRRRAAARHRAPARRPRLQGRGGAVPHVDARRVPGRAHAGDRVHGRRDQGGRVRGDAARASSARSSCYRVDWRPAIWGLAVLSLLVGSIAALVQTDVKRMLAYSSIAHAGYILIGVQAGDRRGNERARSSTSRPTRSWCSARSRSSPSSPAAATTTTRSSTYRGLAAARPVLAGLLTLFLLAQAGVPLTAGFVAKLSVFDAAVDARPVLAGTDRHARPP